MNRNIIIVGAGIGAAIFSTVSMIISISRNRDVDRINKKLGKIGLDAEKVIQDLSDDCVLDIRQEIVDRATEAAINREVHKAVQDISYRIEREKTKEIQKEVNNAIHTSYSEVKKQVYEEAKRRMGTIDTEKLKDQIVTEAKESALNKFDSYLKTVSDNFSESVGNASKIYKAISDALCRE